MKAKYFRKLRKKASYYDVLRSSGLFGDFSSNRFSDDVEWKWAVTVLARTPSEAIRRAYKRGVGRSSYNGTPTTKDWAKWAVKLSDKPNHFRHIMYFD